MTLEERAQKAWPDMVGRPDTRDVRDDFVQIVTVALWEAVQEEREACAVVADECRACSLCESIPDEIRARGR